ncbi:hypothetical protein [Mycobacteroides sp. LB1]|uniref:hypothetical protein n=1 Tax=Mycobacteroides sp. LB1 TaxID=2750814 RepID=UPI0015E0526C|nr:hypothetical protein [Mycobacteroides sp. LB1]
MSRLYDRLMVHGSRLTVYELIDADKYRHTPALQKLRDWCRQDPDKAEYFRSVAPGGKGMIREIWDQAKVFSVDNVHRYLETHQLTHTDLAEILPPLAAVPPYPYMFVEARCPPNPAGARSYGWFVERYEGTEPGVRWSLSAALFVEWEKGRPIGPIGLFWWDLDEHGRQIIRPGDPPLTDDMSTPESPEAPGLFTNFCEGIIYELAVTRVVLTLALGLLHCKNIAETEHEPSPKLQKAFHREHNRTLTRYSTIDITPISRALDQATKSGGISFPQAFHTCRGHFKTYRPEAPLFGRLTGQYWWRDHQRGDKRHGEVISDYRVTGMISDELAGLIYDGPPVSLGPDPDLQTRGHTAHTVLQSQFADALERIGFLPLRPRPDEPQYDLAWQNESHLWVVEVKSTTVANEVRQFRCAIGQVLHYAEQMRPHHEHIHPVIVLENEPVDMALVGACERSGILVLWPNVFDAIPPPAHM